VFCCFINLFFITLHVALELELYISFIYIKDCLPNSNYITNNKGQKQLDKLHPAHIILLFSSVYSPFCGQMDVSSVLSIDPPQAKGTVVTVSLDFRSRK
jgi:hypothetical protein